MPGVLFLLIFLPLFTATSARAQMMQLQVETTSATASLAQAGNAPGSGTWLNVTGIFPRPGERLTNRLVVIFDRPLAAMKPAGGLPPAPLIFTPPLTGDFGFGPNYITFKPDLPPGMELVRAAFSPELRSADGHPLNPAQRVFPITSQPFKPDNPWLLQSTRDRLLLGLTFTFQVALDPLRSHLAVTDKAGKEVPFTVQAGTSPRTFQLQLDKPGAISFPIRVRILRGLREAAGLLALEDTYAFAYGGPTLRELRVQEASWGDLGRTTQTIRVEFTELVDPAQAARFIKVVDISTTAPRLLPARAWLGADRACVIGFAAPDPYDVKVRLEIAPGLTGQADLPLARPHTQLLAFHAALEIERAWVSAESSEEPYLQLTCTQDVELKDFIKYFTIQPRIEGVRIVQENNRNFTIHGNLQADTKYEITLLPGIRFNGWATQKTPVVHEVETPTRFPGFMKLAFEGKYYFPRTANPTLPLSTRNVAKVELVLYRMFPSNIALAPDDIENGDGGWRFAERWSEEIARKQMDLPASSGKTISTPLRLSEILPAGMTGVFMLEVRNLDGSRDEDSQGGSRNRRSRSRWYADSGERLSRIIMMTNLGVLAHWTNKELSLFVHNLYTLTPLEGAHVRIFTTKNQQCGEGWTDAQGLLQLKNFVPTLGAPSIALVEKGSDSTFLDLVARNEENLPFTEEMQPYDHERYDGYLYADRSLYRPGETIHLRWLGRKNYGDALTSVPLEVRVLKPNGESLLKQPVILSEWGTGSLDLNTQKSYPTGSYEVQLAVPAEETPLASYTFQLEEFVPNRLKTTVELPEARWVGLGTTHSVVVAGRHLFGTPAAQRTAEAKIFFERGWAPAAWSQYRFDNDTPYELNFMPLGTLQTGEDGRAHFSCAPKLPQNVASPLQVTVVGTLFEAGGRKVYGRATTMLFPSEVCLGVRGENTPADGQIVIHALAVKPDASVAALDRVDVTLEKQIWNYVVRDYSTYQEPQWSGQYQQLETRPVALAQGQGQTTFTVKEYGYYRVRVQSAATRQFCTMLFYCFGGRCFVTEGAAPALVRLNLDRPLYRVGETAELRVEAPFDGTALVVIQGETIRRVLPVDVRKGFGTVRFVVQPEDFPNAWLEATVVHAIDKNRAQVYPFSSFAMIKLPVEDPERRLEITLGQLPGEVRPAGPLTLEVATRDGSGRPVAAEVTVAAVDEGIHAIKGYANPNPYGRFSRPLRPDYRRAFYYDKVAYDFDQPSPSGDEDLAASLGRPKTNWIRTVALWSGPVRTDENGKARITLNIPEFNGELRVVAVASGKRASGVTAASLLVRRPWMLESSMPRFLLPGDSAQCRATFYNLSDRPCRALVSWSHDGLLSGGEGRREVLVAAHGEAGVAADFTAGRTVGQGTIHWKARVVDPATSQTLENLAEDDPIPVAEPAAYQRREDLIVLKPNETTTITNTFFMEDELSRLTLTAGAQPQLRLQKALSCVIDYPYGCVEQTTSKLLPLYLLRKSRAMFTSTLKDARTVDNEIQAGIDRLFSMQSAEGGLAFWPGMTEPYPYGSIYALHALTLIRNGREFALPENNFALLQNYVRQLAREESGGSPSALYQRAYAIYVLALGGDKKAVDSIAGFDSIPLPRPVRYLLAAALARNTRDGDRVKLYLANAPATPWTVREGDGTLSSEIRNFAVELLSLGQMGAPRAQMEPIAGKLTRYLDTERNGTTQEYAFVTAALCDYLDAMTTDVLHAGAVIVQDGKESVIAGRDVFSGLHRGAGGQFVVRNTGRTDLYLAVTARGVPARAPAAEVRDGMAVRRRFYTRGGTPIPMTTATAFRQGESVIVELEIYNERDAKNVVVADLLPAGLEVENPRLPKEDVQRARMPHASETPTHLEVRDERLVLVYDQLDSCADDKPDETHHFYYVANVVTPGQFTYPAVTAECMYDPAIRGASKAGPLKIEQGK